MSSGNSANPYAPPAEVELTEVGGQGDEEAAGHSRSWRKSLGVWGLVCVVSAAPSFAWGISTIATRQAWAMCLGVAIFVVMYTLLDQVTQNMAWRQDRSVRLALKVGYGTRLAISIIFPIGGVLDMFCGYFSVAAVAVVVPNDLLSGSSPVGPNAGFLVTLLITLVQGCVLNVALACYISLVLGITLLARVGRQRKVW